MFNNNKKIIILNNLKFKINKKFVDCNIYFTLTYVFMV